MRLALSGCLDNKDDKAAYDPAVKACFWDKSSTKRGTACQRSTRVGLGRSPKLAVSRATSQEEGKLEPGSLPVLLVAEGQSPIASPPMPSLTSSVWTAREGAYFSARQYQPRWKPNAYGSGVDQHRVSSAEWTRHFVRTQVNGVSENMCVLVGHKLRICLPCAWWWHRRT